MQVSPPVRFGVLTLLGVLAAGLLWLGINRYQAEQRAAETAAQAIAERSAAPKGQPAAVEPPAEKPKQQLYVHVEGAVKSPGVYTLEEGARVADALNLAGGPVRVGDPKVDGDPSDLNLAERLTDGAKVYVKTKAQVQGEAPAPAAAQSATVKPVQSANGGSTAGGSGSAKASGGKVNVNTATKQQLQSVTGIGPAMADKIVQGRPYKTLDDLTRVSGIGPKTLEKLRPYLTV